MSGRVPSHIPLEEHLQGKFSGFSSRGHLQATISLAPNAPALRNGVQTLKPSSAIPTHIL